VRYFADLPLTICIARRSCSDAADDGGQLLFQRDHDNDITTPLRCGGYDYATGLDSLDSYVPASYDAVVAIARAAHKVVEGGANECVCERGREKRAPKEIWLRRAPTTTPFFRARFARAKGF
jgi:hypothetical protein